MSSPGRTGGCGVWSECHSKTRGVPKARGRRPRLASFDEETVSRVSWALQRRRSQDEQEEGSKEKKAAQIEKGCAGRALREAVLSSLEEGIHTAACHSGVSAGAVFAVREEELCTSDSKWMEEKDNPRPDSASLRHLNELCGVKQECAWTPRDMREALKLILIHGEQVGVAGACVK